MTSRKTDWMELSSVNQSACCTMSGTSGNRAGCLARTGEAALTRSRPACWRRWAPVSSPRTLHSPHLGDIDVACHFHAFCVSYYSGVTTVCKTLSRNTKLSSRSVLEVNRQSRSSGGRRPMPHILQNAMTKRKATWAVEKEG